MSMPEFTATFQCDQPVLLRDNETATQLYRIVQEATTNSIKHANPTQIAISLSGDAERVVLRIADDGSGIRVDQSPISGMGLRTMAYRASMIKSDLAIQPLPEGGTEVICSVPGELRSVVAVPFGVPAAGHLRSLGPFALRWFPLALTNRR